MGNLISGDYMPASRRRQGASSANAGPGELDSYNRSSLALDELDDVAAQWPHQLPRLISTRYSTTAAQERVLFKGLDPQVLGRSRKSSILSFGIHALIVALVLWWGITAHPRVVQTTDTALTPMHFTLYLPPPPPPPVMPVAKAAGGGGGGGAHQVVEPPHGQPPKVARIQTLPPQIMRVNNPKLAVEPTMRVNIPTSTPLPNFGMTQSPQVALAQQGSGSGSGFGQGFGGGIGASQGSGAGTGTGGGYGGGVMSIGGGVRAPVLIHSVEPQFTDQAREANYQGTVTLQIIVDAQGVPQDIHVVRSLGKGLEEKAIEAVRQYRFKPAVYQGSPVAVQMQVEVEFRLH
jgi:periplasmic protein TonB